MGNIFGTAQKVATKGQLFKIGTETLQQHGWKVERIPGLGKSSVRRITKDGQSRKVSIRTSQDTWIAFPRNKRDTSWVTLSDVDVVLAVSVNDADDPKFAQVHMIEGDEMRQRFDRAYAARKAEGHTVQLGRGVWLSLYHTEAKHPVNRVGAGAGLVHPPIARIPLGQDALSSGPETIEADYSERPLTIAEAKRRLAMTFGVEPSNIKITVEA